jgi:hypothetical protein
MLFRNLIWILGLKSWEYKLPKWLPYQQLKKITVTNTIIIKRHTKSLEKYSPSPINNIYIDHNVEDYPQPSFKIKCKIGLYIIWTIFLICLQCVQPTYLIYKIINRDGNIQELINLFLLYILMPIHYIWVKIYFSTTHFNNFFLKKHWSCTDYCNKLTILSLLISILSIIPHFFFREHINHYWSHDTRYFWYTFIPIELVGRNIILINSGIFMLIFYNHLNTIYNFTKEIDNGNSHFHFNNTNVLSEIIFELSKIKSELKCSIERFENLVSLTTGIGGSALVLFIQNKYTTQELTLNPIEIYTLVSLIYYMISQLVFFYILYKYSSIRENIHKYVNSINFINKYIKRSLLKEPRNKTQFDNKMMIIEEESATTIDWLILDRLIKENWIDFTILGVSTRDGSLIKKVLTFSTIFYTLLKFF